MVFATMCHLEVKQRGLILEFLYLEMFHNNWGKFNMTPYQYLRYNLHINFVAFIQIYCL